jgi:hypothetical protein
MDHDDGSIRRTDLDGRRLREHKGRGGGQSWSETHGSDYNGSTSAKEYCVRADDRRGGAFSIDVIVYDLRNNGSLFLIYNESSASATWAFNV